MGGVAAHVAQRAYRVQTSRGVHVYLKLLGPTPNMHIAGELDVMAKHKLVTGPGSVHATGAVYTPMNAMFFPVVETLSDTLPASLLMRGAAPRPAAAVTPLPALDDDPWHPTVRPDLGSGPVARIKAQYKIANLIPTNGKRGAWHTVNCPFHDDTNPSAGITPDGERFVCFAGCNQKPWDVIEVFAALHGLSNREAIFEMAKGL
jgi:Ni,Fe-hydrogenase III small subunit